MKVHRFSQSSLLRVSADSVLQDQLRGTTKKPHYHRLLSLLSHSQGKTLEKLGSLRERELLSIWGKLLSPSELMLIHQAATVLTGEHQGLSQQEVF